MGAAICSSRSFSRIHLSALLRSPGITRLLRYYGSSDSWAAALCARVPALSSGVTARTPSDPPRSPCFMHRIFPPFHLQPPVVASGSWSGFVPEPTARSGNRIPFSGPGRHLGFTLPSRLATTTGRIEFVILRTSGSPPVALHPLSRGRSYFRLRSSDPTSARTFTCRFDTLTSALGQALRA